VTSGLYRHHRLQFHFDLASTTKPRPFSISIGSAEIHGTAFKEPHSLRFRKVGPSVWDFLAWQSIKLISQQILFDKTKDKDAGL
jgi:hypothetical protein